MVGRTRNTSPFLLIACVALVNCGEPEDEFDSPLPSDEIDEDVDEGWVPPVRFEADNAVGEAVAVDENGGAVSLQLEPARVSWAPQEEVEARRAERGALSARPSSTDRTLERIAAMEPTDRISVLVTLHGPDFDFSRLRGSEDGDRASLIDERRDTLAAAQAAVEPELERLSATIVGRRWISPRVVVEIEAGRAAAIAELPAVKKVALDDAFTSSWAADGTDFRDQMLAGELIDAGYDSLQGGQATGSRVRVGIIEAEATSTYNWPTQSHVGWLTWPNGSTRLRTVEICVSSGCFPTSASANGASHGNTVMWAAAGDYTDGQDTTLPPAGGGALPPPDPEEQRSGIAVESWMYYYGHDTCSGMESALEEAVASGVDIVNISSGVAAGECDPGYDCMNDAIRAAFDAGVVIVAAAGNGGHTGGCQVDYPALRSEVLSVGQLDSENVYTPIFGNLYFDMRLGDSSPKGPVPITLQSGLVRDMAGIDLVAMGKYRHYYTSAPNGTTLTEVEGTSFAAPVVTGVAANMRDMFDSIGWTGAATNAGVAMVNMMLAADRWDGLTFDDTTRGVSDYSGFGRVWARWPSSTSLTGPWGWGWRYFTLQDGQTNTWTVGGSGPESASVTQWKWAVTWFDPDLESTSDVVIEVYDTCPAGGGEVRVDYDFSYDIRKAVHLLQEDITGKCLEMRATAYQAPPGGIRVYSADYYHGATGTRLH